MSEPRGPAFPFEEVIAARANQAGIELAAASARALADHARLVLARNAMLNLTAIVSPADFVERHLGEAFEGAALIPAAILGRLVDLGSGNGYPGIALAHARPGLTPYLAESNGKKAAFLREALAAAGLPRGHVVEKSVQRAADLDGISPIAILATKAMGGWERIVPKLRGCLGPEGRILVWAGESFAACPGAWPGPS